MKQPIYVIKLGSSTILQEDRIFNEIRGIVDRGAPVLVVAGGGEAIQLKYNSLNRPIPYVTLKNGERFRYCSPEEMPHIVAAYDEIIAPKLIRGFEKVGIRPYVSIAGRNQLVCGTRSKPLRTVDQGRELMIRDSLVGTFHSVDQMTIESLLESRRLVCLMPPIAEAPGAVPGTLKTEAEVFLNIDADMLAASLSVALGAHHLRFVTGTAGILSDVTRPDSTIHDVYRDDELFSVTGRMKQKLRAARVAASDGIGDVMIIGPHTLSQEGSLSQTRFWPSQKPSPKFELLVQVSSIASVSGDEAELAAHLKGYANQLGLEAAIDSTGNFVARKGNGPVKLMLLGHLDTVPFLWKPQWDGYSMSARGVVDAKGCVANFLEAAILAQVPDWGQLVLVGATEEEVSSSKGAFYARDHYPAQAVIIGEPSGSQALTLGYFGLFKLKIAVKVPAGHSAGKEAISAPDLLIRVCERIKLEMRILDHAGISSLIEFQSDSDVRYGYAQGTLNFRVSPEASIDQMIEKLGEFQNELVKIELLRATPGVQTSRSSDLIKSFGRAFASQNITPRYLVKKGSSDMNTLATTWKDVPMIAYGPGDASLDHTDHEKLTTGEYQISRLILDRAISEYFTLKRPTYAI